VREAEAHHLWEEREVWPGHLGTASGLDPNHTFDDARSQLLAEHVAWRLAIDSQRPQQAVREQT
jgi:hypothetical protein